MRLNKSPASVPPMFLIVIVSVDKTPRSSFTTQATVCATIQIHHWIKVMTRFQTLVPFLDFEWLRHNLHRRWSRSLLLCLSASLCLCSLSEFLFLWLWSLTFSSILSRLLDRDLAFSFFSLCFLSFRSRLRDRRRSRSFSLSLSRRLSTSRRCRSRSRSRSRWKLFSLCGVLRADDVFRGGEDRRFDGDGLYDGDVRDCLLLLGGGLRPRLRVSWDLSLNEKKSELLSCGYIYIAQHANELS